MIETQKRSEGQASGARDQRLDLRLPSDLLEDVRRLSARTERSVSATTRLALAELVRREDAARHA